MSVPLEDLFEDIVGKAQRGLKLSDPELVTRAGIDMPALARLGNGSGTQKEISGLAAALGLKPEPLWESFQRSWEPETVALGGLEQVNTDLLGMTVNAYVLWDTSSRVAALFDAGIEPATLSAIVDRHGLSLQSIFITHTHEDHVAALREVVLRTHAPVYAPAGEPVSGAKSVQEGDHLTIGGLEIEARLTNGHSPAGTSYVVRGLTRTVAVVGDSLFAGSMGGAPNAYSLAIKNNREKLLSLPDDTIICPGHGPMTTVANERLHNPFVAD
jgi:hydroxyacylglutathione hydrolase